ncbi:MAG: ribbon-helix-helix protein, CopG family [Gemmatimonadetes bacterium]|nr:ribbon-helix-helix protein, CopG family [Gemmatimonadota bacterium]
MVRTQIQLTQEQAAALRALAAGEGLSMAELVRTAVDRLLGDRRAVDAAERRRRALDAVGRFASGRSDVAREHDRYLAEAYEP